MSATIRLVGLAGVDAPSEYDGQYLVEYDPERDGTSPSGLPMNCVLRTTSDRSAARLFADGREALECWRRVPSRAPVRPYDGLPNRPLTAFTVEIEDL